MFTRVIPCLLSCMTAGPTSETGGHISAQNIQTSNPGRDLRR
jgi:hypothetical protein